MPRSEWVFDRFCLCGCDVRIMRPCRWAHGHAASLRNRLMADFKRGDLQARKRMMEYGWKVPLMPERPQYGVEAEFFGITAYDAIDALRDAGLDAEDDGYHHNERPYWRITDDSSVNGNGQELVSPILRVGHEDDKDDLALALDALRDKGAVVDETCGLHVHHDVQSYEPAEIAETVAQYAYFQPVINRIIHPNRLIRCEYGMPMRDPMDWHERITCFEHYSKLYAEANSFGRSHAVNVTSIPVHGTLEFRQHAGTLYPEIAQTWVDFTRLFMRVGKRHSLIEAMGLFGRGYPDCTVDELALFLGAGNDLIDALIKREKHYHGTEGEWGEEDQNLDHKLDGYSRDYEEDYDEYPQGDDGDPCPCPECDPRG